MARRKRARRRSPERPSASSSSSAVVAYTGDDRLSDLPPELRYQILGLLPLKYAIRTGALNKGWCGFWKQRWPRSSTLNFVRQLNISYAQFINDINRFLRDRPLAHRLDCLRLVFYPGQMYLPFVKIWLDRATDCGVEVLLLDFTPPPPLPPLPPPPVPRRGRPPKNGPRPFPITSFSFSSGGPALSNLAIRGVHLTVPKNHFKKLISLETLRLYNVVLTDATLRRITSELPLLRKLYIRGCPQLKRATIHGRSIAKLVIIGCHNINQLNVFAPTLRSLHFSNVMVNTYNIVNVVALEDVYLSCGGPGTPALMDGNWVGALGPLCNVRVLTLCSMSLQYIAIKGGNVNGGFFRIFASLQELQLLMVGMADSNLMDIFSFFHLCPCPRLEKLFIVLPTHMRDASMEMFLDTAEVAPPANCFEHLRMIKMTNFKGHNNELRLLRFLLATAAHLETLVIVAPLEHLTDDYGRDIFHKMEYLDMQFESMTKASPNFKTFVYGRDNYKFRPTHDVGYCNI